MEKPEFLYHGSARGGINEFQPQVSKGSGEKYGPLVYATPDLATAVIFTANVKGPWSAGRFGEVHYALIPMNREEFIANDKGGFVYVLPGATFETQAGRGLGELEWASAVAVRPTREIEFKSSLDAMLEHDVQVYFVTEDVYRRALESKDRGRAMLYGMKSENQLRNQNVQLFTKM